MQLSSPCEMYKIIGKKKFLKVKKKNLPINFYNLTCDGNRMVHQISILSILNFLFHSIRVQIHSCSDSLKWFLPKTSCFPQKIIAWASQLIAPTMEYVQKLFDTMTKSEV